MQNNKKGLKPNEFLFTELQPCISYQILIKKIFLFQEAPLS